MNDDMVMYANHAILCMLTCRWLQQICGADWRCHRSGGMCSSQTGE